MHVEDRVEYHSDHRDSYTLQSSTCMHGEWGDNLLAGFIKLDPWNSACGRKSIVPQYS